MVFTTTTGTDMSISIPRVRATLTAADLRQVMQTMIDNAAIDGGAKGNLTGVKSGALYKISKQTYQFS